MSRYQACPALISQSACINNLVLYSVLRVTNSHVFFTLYTGLGEYYCIM